MARLGGLGKGLGALIPAGEAAGDDRGDGPVLVEIPVGSITPNPHQPRVHFDEEALSELVASVRELGIIQPILVRPLAEGHYELVAGERRWRAAQRAGLDVVPAVVRTTDELGSVERALVENLHRQDLTPLEEAAAYQQLVDDFGYTHEQLATRMGKSRSAISNTLRLLTLPPSIQHLLADGRLSAGHAKALLGTPDRAFQEHLAKRAVTEGWSVRAVEEAVRERSGSAGVTKSNEDEPEGAGSTAGRPSARSAGKLRSPGLLELEERFAERLSTRVAVSMGTKRGKIVIEFADLEDLERLYLLIAGGDPNGSSTG